ncbi:MAG: hypothetical protein COA51_01590 [Idiomarina sp.]|uniref:Methylamine utilization protein n=2 Tax=Pseudidiomarina marina TaxID=502366 RepID=A0A432YKP1_9GAMM|nr:MAG: hypothetical protein COA51_01590 [Idiomarina sp.]RUO61496.1 hypothetical protein CWI76_04375 [Pseudidiomarina marina]
MANDTLTVTVLDRNQQPLALAVVSINGVESANQTSTVAIMDQVDRLFVPYVLVVRENSQVKFPNSDNIRHQVYSFSEVKPFELPLYSNREAPEIRFEQSGIVVLGCNIHDHMQAYIYVSPHELSRQTDNAGQVMLPAGASNVHIWYPSLTDTVTDEMVVPLVEGQTQLTVTLPIQAQQQNPPPVSALQQRFNRRKNNN